MFVREHTVIFDPDDRVKMRRNKCKVQTRSRRGQLEPQRPRARGLILVFSSVFDQVNAEQRRRSVVEMNARGQNPPQRIPARAAHLIDGGAKKEKTPLSQPGAVTGRSPRSPSLSEETVHEMSNLPKRMFFEGRGGNFNNSAVRFSKNKDVDFPG